MSRSFPFVDSVGSLFELEAKKTAKRFEKKHFDLLYDTRADDVNAAWLQAAQEINDAYCRLMEDAGLTKLRDIYQEEMNRSQQQALHNLSTNLSLDFISSMCKADEAADICSFVQRDLGRFVGSRK